MLLLRSCTYVRRHYNANVCIPDLRDLNSFQLTRNAFESVTTVNGVMLLVKHVTSSDVSWWPAVFEEKNVPLFPKSISMGSVGRNNPFER